MKLSVNPSIVLLSHGRASPLGLAAWGRESGRARCQGGLSLGGAAFGKAGFFGSCGNSLLLAENYNRTTTNNTAEAQSAQRLNGGGRNNLRLDDPCGLWASLARQPLDPWQLPWPVSKAHASGSAVRGPGRPGCISDARQAGLPGVNRSVDEGR